jgi:lysozyme
MKAVRISVVALALAALFTPIQASAATSCHDGAVTAHYGDALELGPYKTTSRCNDINLLLTDGTADYVDACVKFLKTGKCNYWTRVYRGVWRTIATDVLDNTKFTVPLGIPLEGDSATVKIAF